MDTVSSIASAVEAIERGLRAPLRVESLAAQAAHYSTYHFLRLFRLHTGETPGSYLRKRRLSEAAREVTAGRRSVLSIALEYQFGSSAAFSRSFKEQFGLSPSQQRETQSFLHLTPPAIPCANAGAEEVVPVAIRPFPALNLAGARYHGDNRDGQLTRVWRQFMEQIESLPHQLTPPQTYGLWRYPTAFTTTRQFDYLAGAALAAPAAPPGFASARLAARRYAVFEHHGPLSAVRRTYIAIYGHWLPRAGQRPGGAYDLEGYDQRFTGPDQPESVMSILVPLAD